MAEVLLNFIMPTTISPAPPVADLSFLRRAALVSATEASENDATVLPSSLSDYQPLIDKLGKVDIVNSADLADYNRAYTVIFTGDLDVQVSDQYVSAKAYSDLAEAQADKSKGIIGFITPKNLSYALGSFLQNSNTYFSDIQYLNLPESELGSNYESYFSDKLTFAITDDIYGNVLGLIANAQNPLQQAYLSKMIVMTLQAKAYAYIATNHPHTYASDISLFESYLQKEIDKYVIAGAIEDGEISMTVSPEGNWTASASIEIPAISTLWRIYANLQEGN